MALDHLTKSGPSLMFAQDPWTVAWLACPQDDHHFVWAVKWLTTRLLSVIKSWVQTGDPQANSGWQVCFVWYEECNKNNFSQPLNIGLCYWKSGLTASLDNIGRSSNPQPEFPPGTSQLVPKSHWSFSMGCVGIGSLVCHPYPRPSHFFQLYSLSLQSS